MTAIFIRVMIGFCLANAAAAEVSEIQLKTLLTGSHTSKILSLDSNPQGQLLSLSKDDLKIWNVSRQELIKNIQETSSYYKAEFSDDGSKVYALSAKKITIYNTSDFSEILSIPYSSHSRDFLVTNDDTRLYLLDGYSVDVYDLGKKEKINRFKIERSETLELTPDEKYILTFDRHNKKARFFQSLTGALVNTISYEEYAQYIYLLDNQRVAYIYDEEVKRLNVRGYKTDYQTYNFKTSIKESNHILEKRVSSAKAINDFKLSLIAFNGDSSIHVHTLEGESTNKRFAGLSNVSIRGLHLSKNGKLLAVGSKDGKFALYDSSEQFLSKTAAVNSVAIEETYAPEVVVLEEASAPQDIAVEIPKPQVQALKVVPSTTEGVVPLEVTFSIISSHPELIDSYYINLLGKEIMNKGAPPMTLTKTFHRAGSFKLFIAIRDAEGNIVDTEVVIKPREQTFADFKAVN